MQWSSQWMYDINCQYLNVSLLLSCIMVSKGKAKEKKQQRKEMLARMGAAQQLLSKANVPDKDHMDTLIPFKVCVV